MASLLDADRRLILDLSQEDLQQHLDLTGSGLLQTLFQNRILTSLNIQAIRSGQNEAERISLFTECLKRKSSQHFDDFCGVLQGLGLDHIYHELLSPSVIDKHVKALQDKLCRYFIEDYSMVDMFSFHDEGHSVRLDKVYVPVKWATYHRTPETTIKKELSKYTDIFQKSHPDEPANLIVVKGKPMAGKTTITRKMSNDWAQILYTKNVHNEHLSEFKVVIPIILRLVKPNSTLSDILQHQLDFLTPNDIKLINWMLAEEPERILIIFDGLDEYFVSNSPEILDIMKRTKKKKVPTATLR